MPLCCRACGESRTGWNHPLVFLERGKYKASRRQVCWGSGSSVGALHRAAPQLEAGGSGQPAIFPGAGTRRE